ncbi:MAG: oxepin-CoA hydrolase/3-oxo-5,6-dehydrosuberyl-CoA semialdehyde dehydrogenase, partial [Limisphaerales bacterium]
QRIGALKEDTKAVFGILTPQHMVEHMESVWKIALGEIDSPIDTPEKFLEKYQESLWNYKSMPLNFAHPPSKVGELELLRHKNLKEASDAMLKAYDALELRFKEDDSFKSLNPVFGMLDHFENTLLNQKHLHHHFKQFGLEESPVKNEVYG